MLLTILFLEHAESPGLPVSSFRPNIPPPGFEAPPASEYWYQRGGSGGTGIKKGGYWYQKGVNTNSVELQLRGPL